MMDSKIEADMKDLKKKLVIEKQKYAQAESDKIELMRDLATFHSNACENIELYQNFGSMLKLVRNTSSKIQTLDNQNDMFVNRLLQSVQNGTQ